MDDARVSIVQRLDNPATGLLIGLFALAVQAACFVVASGIDLGTAPAAIAGSVAGAFALALVLWSRDARWSAAWVAALSSVWAYLAVLLAMSGVFWSPVF